LSAVGNVVVVEAIVTPRQHGAIGQNDHRVTLPYVETDTRDALRNRRWAAKAGRSRRRPPRDDRIVRAVNGGLNPPDSGGLGWVWFSLLQRSSWLWFRAEWHGSAGGMRFCRTPPPEWGLHRVFRCLKCECMVKVCRSCDRRQRYCSQECALAARASSLRAAGRKYQSTDAGRQKNAQRQARWRARQRGQERGRSASSVTHPQAVLAASTTPPSPGSMHRAKWPTPAAAISRRPAARVLVRRKIVYLCDFCSTRKCLFASRKEVWPGPSWQRSWHGRPPESRGS
jgi:hypothetical protein